MTDAAPEPPLLDRVPTSPSVRKLVELRYALPFVWDEKKPAEPPLTSRELRDITGSRWEWDTWGDEYLEDIWGSRIILDTPEKLLAHATEVSRSIAATLGREHALAEIDDAPTRAGVQQALSRLVSYTSSAEDGSWPAYAEEVLRSQGPMQTEIARDGLLYLADRAVVAAFAVDDRVEEFVAGEAWNLLDVPGLSALTGGRRGSVSDPVHAALESIGWAYVDSFGRTAAAFESFSRLLAEGVSAISEHGADAGDELEKATQERFRYGFREWDAANRAKVMTYLLKDLPAPPPSAAETGAPAADERWPEAARLRSATPTLTKYLRGGGTPALRAAQQKLAAPAPKSSWVRPPARLLGVAETARRVAGLPSSSAASGR